MECRWNYSKFLRANKTNPTLIFSPKRKLTGVHKREPTGEARAFAFRPSAPAVGYFWGVARAAGVCATEERRRTIPQERQKKGFHTFPRRERGLGMDAGGFFLGGGGATRLSDSLESA